MCDSSERLVAWMDGELGENESAEIEQHVRACAECHACVSAWEDASRDFAAYYASTAQAALTMPHRKVPRWVPVAIATAAAVAIILLASLPHSAKPVPAVPQVAVTHLPVAAEPATKSITPVRRAHTASHRKAPSENWAMVEPAIQIAIPADAMFPPGAVPEGVTYIANLSLTDGSVQAIRLQP